MPRDEGEIVLLDRWVESNLYLTILGVLRGAEADAALLEHHPVQAAWHDYQDLLALTFSDPVAEADWIADKIAVMRGTLFSETNGRTRGLSWSECAILLRSVRNTAGPIVDALTARGIPTS